MKQILYKQCVLRRIIKYQIFEETTRWLPHQFAITGNVVKLKEFNEWTDGWLIIEVSDSSATEEQLSFNKHSL